MDAIAYPCCKMACFTAVSDVSFAYPSILCFPAVTMADSCVTGQVLGYGS